MWTYSSSLSQICTMNAPTPTKRAKLSCCDVDFLVKLHQSFGVNVNNQIRAGGGGDASASAPPELTTCLRQSFLSLLNYGADVNINLNWRRALDHDEEEVTPPTPLNLTLCEGEVNCDVDHERPPLHESDQVQARMDQDVLVRLLTNVGMGINCPQLPGDADPLVLEEARQRFAVLKALVTFGTDTNRVRSRCERDEVSNSCEFCWNLQFLRNFGTFQTMGEKSIESCERMRRLVLNALLATGSEVNGIRCGGAAALGPESGGQFGGHYRITDLLVTNGHKVNSVMSEDDY
ncbi:uncharacterized protein LOC110855927 isoform X2 [Folsomia candida]|uniref:uncharacterized protein LOC110855927 isoform X2 n=1 Tax=Folsomia candida TaxID=158441 RepID=UPI000B8EEA94|nr:uncharacterized protein LOC110855927 isoform X2 [Folsomia candida]